MIFDNMVVAYFWATL